MNSRINKEKAVSWGMFVFFLLIIFLLIPVTYAINDDVAMRDIASGAMSGKPDYHLVFVKAALGIVLSAAYRYFPGIDWYGLSWMGFIILSGVLILWKFLSACEKKGKNLPVAAVFFLLLFTLTFLSHLVSFQFTVTAGILAGAAIFVYSLDDSSGKKEYLTAVLVIVLIWLSFCVRENVLMMAVPFGGLIILYKKESVRKKAVMALIVAAGLAGIMALEFSVYSGEEWTAYKEYNMARSVIYDYYGVPSYEENKEFYDSIGLQEYDVVNLERYHLALVDGLEEGKMQQIAEYARQLYIKETSFFTRIKSGIKMAIHGELNKETVILNLITKLLILLNLVWGFKKNKKYFLSNIGFLLCEGLLVLYLGYEGRLPERVMAALLFIELLSALGIFLKEYKSENCGIMQKAPQWVMRAALILLIITAGWKFLQIRIDQTNRFASNIEYRKLQTFYQENPENVYFISVNWIAGYSDNFQLCREFSLSNGFNLGGWTTYMPVHEQGLQCFGIENEDVALIEKDNVYLIFNFPSSKITSHYEEKYEEVYWTEVDKAPVYGMEVPVFKITGGDRK